MRYQSAFVLIEALFVLSIVVILSLLTIPGLREMFSRAQDIHAREALVNLLKFARNEADMERKTVTICKSHDLRQCGGEWSQGQIAYIDTARAGKLHSSDQIIMVNEMQSARGSLHVRFFPFYRDVVNFYPPGLGVNDNGTFWYCRKGSHLPSWAIKINRAGNIDAIRADANGDIRDASGKLLSC